jgi:hypothetical protein
MQPSATDERPKDNRDRGFDRRRVSIAAMRCIGGAGRSVVARAALALPGSVQR